MNSVLDAIRQFFDLFKFWFVIAPWEAAVLVRAGKHAYTRGPSVHWRWPLVDRVYIQSVRRRISGLGRQSLTTADGKTVTVSSTLGYSISDVALLYGTLHHAEDTIANIARELICEFVESTSAVLCTGKNLREFVQARLDLAPFGIAEVELNVIELITVKGYRLIGDGSIKERGAPLSTDFYS